MYQIKIIVETPEVNPKPQTPNAGPDRSLSPTLPLSHSPTLSLSHSLTLSLSHSLSRAVVGGIHNLIDRGMHNLTDFCGADRKRRRCTGRSSNSTSPTTSSLRTPHRYPLHPTGVPRS